MPAIKQNYYKLIEPINSKRIQKAIEKHISETEEIIVQISGNCDQTLIMTAQGLYIMKPGFTARAGFGTKVTRYSYNQITTLEITMLFQTGVFWFAGSGISSPFRTYRDYEFDVFYTAPNCIPFTPDKKPLFENAIQIFQELVG